MPFIKLYTTLSKDKLPERFMPQLVEELSVIISKDKKWFNWILETDKCMSKVSLLKPFQNKKGQKNLRYPTKSSPFLGKKTAFLSGTSNFFGPSYFEAALVLGVYLVSL